MTTDSASDFFCCFLDCDQCSVRVFSTIGTDCADPVPRKMEADAGRREAEQIFKRDQRTIKTREEAAPHIKFDAFQLEFCGSCKRGRRPPGGCPLSITRLPVIFFRISNLGMYAVAGSPFRTCNDRCRTKKSRVDVSMFKRLVQVFVFAVCFLTIVRAPTAMSAPISCKDRDGADEPPPKWKNPCGEECVMDNYSSGSGSGEDDSVTPILTMARIAVDYMHNFKENYTKHTFGVSYGTYHHMFEDSTHHWLPNRETEIPRNLTGEVDISHLEAQELDDFLKKIYEYMQRYAVGIEQVVWDQQATNGRFRSQFNITESNLRKVLCEIRTVMDRRNIAPTNEVNRCIMDEQMRKMSGTVDRNLRDWIIFKECINGLEYLIQVFEYFYKNSPS